MIDLKKDIERSTDHGFMVRIGALIEDLQKVHERFGNTCVYIRNRGLSWGAVALSRFAHDESHPAVIEPTEMQLQEAKDIDHELAARLLAQRDHYYKEFEATQKLLRLSEACRMDAEDECEQLRKAFADLHRFFETWEGGWNAVLESALEDRVEEFRALGMQCAELSPDRKDQNDV